MHTQNTQDAPGTDVSEMGIALATLAIFFGPGKQPTPNAPAFDLEKAHAKLREDDARAAAWNAAHPLASKVCTIVVGTVFISVPVLCILWAVWATFFAN
jgi:hypothetical protein